MFDTIHVMRKGEEEEEEDSELALWVVESDSQVDDRRNKHWFEEPWSKVSCCWSLVPRCCPVPGCCPVTVVMAVAVVAPKLPRLWMLLLLLFERLFLAVE